MIGRPPAKSDVEEPKEHPPTPSESGSTIRLTLSGLITLCVALVAVTAAVTRLSYAHRREVEALGPASQPPAVPSQETPRVGEEPPWGQLCVVDLEVRQPMEYVALEATQGREPRWAFPGQSPEGLRAVLERVGFTPVQLGETLSPERVAVQADGVVVRPTDETVLSLGHGVRERLYTILSRSEDNRFMRHPYHLPGDAFEDTFARSGVSQEAINLVGRLLYSRGGHRYFSDPEVVLRRIPTEDERQRLLQALSCQPAVMASLLVGPDSDIDRLVGYWASGPWLREKDLRPLLESMQRTPSGGAVSLLLLLPPFARERLFTFPMPTEIGAPNHDCHWTALNFFHETPDDRMGDAQWASQHVRENFYRIGKPSRPGDLVFLIDDKDGVIHSAVFIADDIVFTKNGVNFGQPWLLMRMAKLLEVYSLTSEPRAVYYRRKEA